MKAKIILRVLAAPFVFFIILIPTSFNIIKRVAMFLRYGGEWINYTKDDKITIEMIYKQLKQQTPPTP